MAEQVIVRFRQQAERSFEGSTAKQMKRDAWYKADLSKILELFLIVRPHPADHTIGAGGDIQQRNIVDDRHYTVLAGNRLTVRTTLGVPGDLVDAVLHLVVHAQGKLVRKLVGL